MPSARLWRAPGSLDQDTGPLRVVAKGAWALALVATAGSLSLSGIPAIGWAGMGLIPCELCWYQRILMYPLVVLLGVQAFREERDLRSEGLALSVPGALVAGYHSLIQVFPALEAGQCTIGACSAKLWTLGPLTVPNLSFIAFLAITGLLAGSLLAD